MARHWSRAARILGFTLLILAPPLVATRAVAANCGGAVPCACGDTVVGSRTLVHGVDPITTAVCPADGLVVPYGVTLDLGGTTIRGRDANSTGLLLAHPVGRDVTGVTVTNGTITGFGLGLLGFINDSHISGLRLVGNGRGMDVVFGGNVIERNVFRRNAGAGLAVFFGPANVVRHNRAEGNGGDGIRVDGTATVSRNVATLNGGTGLEVTGGTVVDRNRAAQNGGPGFRVFGTEVVASRNVAYANAGDGFFIDATESVFQRNRSQNNAGFGIAEFRADAGNLFDANVCSGNGLGDSNPPGLCD